MPIFATNLATVAGVLAYLGWLSWPVLLAVLGVVAVEALGFRLIAGAAMRAFERAREERDTLLGHFRALIEGIKELKLSAARRAAFLAEVLEPSAEAYRRKVARGRRLYTSASGRGAGGPRAAGFRLSADRPRRRHTPLHAGARSFTLGPIDLTIRPGELLFLVGGNGSGKTTLGKLLAGLYAPETGEVRLDGVPVTDTTREYLQRLELSHKVTIEGGILSTTALSQGQRKRLALLAAYLEDRPVYLFDE